MKPHAQSPAPIDAAAAPADFVLRFLDSVSSRSEADFYLGLFRAVPKERFAAISVDATVANYALEAVVVDLRFLVALGLCPLVVLGLFDNADAEVHAERLRRLLEREQVPSVLASPFSPTLAEDITAAAQAGAVPILAFTRAELGGLFVDGTTAVYAAVEARTDRLGRLLSALQTRKMIFLVRRGGLTVRGNPVEVVNLTADYESLLASRELTRKERLLVHASRHLVMDLCSHRLLVAITSPFDLLRELFSSKGAGTLLRRGAVVVRHEGLEGVDLERLRGLIERSFGRAVHPSFFTRKVARVYLEESYRGAAMIVDTPLGAYLTKFAVEREAQGEGIGRDLWDALAADYPTLFWRARAENPIGGWYARLAHGLARFSGWTVYWRGLPTTQIAPAIEWALSQPVDLPQAHGSDE